MIMYKRYAERKIWGIGYAKIVDGKRNTEFPFHEKRDATGSLFLLPSL